MKHKLFWRDYTVNVFKGFKMPSWKWKFFRYGGNIVLWWYTVTHVILHVLWKYQEPSAWFRWQSKIVILSSRSAIHILNWSAKCECEYMTLLNYREVLLQKNMVVLLSDRLTTMQQLFTHIPTYASIHVLWLHTYYDNFYTLVDCYAKKHITKQHFNICLEWKKKLFVYDLYVFNPKLIGLEVWTVCSSCTLNFELLTGAWVLISGWITDWW